ncbi:MAG: DUF5114 domain-containing protein [Bacteroidales bacterium]|nr:DUF5114 domain-containing protein [Bacteroidales bacterium]
MKRTYIIGAVVALAAACTPAEDIRVTTTGPERVKISCSGDVVLSRDNNTYLALTVNWTDNNNVGTYGVAGAPKNSTVNTLQFSANQDFNPYTEYQAATGATSAQFTAGALNTIAIKAGMKGGVKAPLYIRLASTLGSNITPVYSEVISTNVTPYSVDLSVGHVLDKDGNDTGKTLKKTADGIYEGFLGVAGWYNWFLLEGDGTKWGNLGQDGKQFYISSAESQWNMWFPEPAGCYYVTVDTGKGEWTALNIPALKIAGDIAGEMTYNRSTNSWSIATDKTGTVKVTISGSGNRYNTTTGDSSFDSEDIGFGGSASEVTFGKEAGEITVDLGSGSGALNLNLGSMTIGSGSDKPTTPEVPVYLYAVGVNDGWTNADWDFENYLILSNESKKEYTGVCNINSKWGYRFYTEKDNWSGFYGWTEGDWASGKLEADKDSNVPAPEVGLYLMQVSLDALTYSNSTFESVQIAGVGKDDGESWELVDMASTDVAGVYETAIDVAGKTAWGFKIYLDEDWDKSFGCSTDMLVWGEDGIPLGDEYIGTRCQFTVDLCKGTCEIKKL